MIEIVAQVRQLPPNRLVSEHWKSRAWRRRKEHEATAAALAWAIKRGVVFPIYPIVTIIRVAARRTDSDAAPFAAKTVRDAIARFYGVDDADAVDDPYATAPIVWRYGFERKWEKEKHFTRTRCISRMVSFTRIQFEPRVERAIGGVDATCERGGDGLP